MFEDLVAWVGFRSVGVEHEREERFAGTSKAHTIGVLQLATKAVFAHSQVPLMMIPLVGAGLFVASFISLMVLTVDWMTRGVPFPGFGTIVALMIMLFGILFCLLGIVSIYIGQIYDEVKGRPNFIVRQTSVVGRSHRSNSAAVRSYNEAGMMHGAEAIVAEDSIATLSHGTNGVKDGSHAAVADGDPPSRIRGA